jgi:hypothetical protein
MRSSDATLIAHLLNNQEFKYAELYTLELLSGDVLRYCDVDFDVTHGGNTWLSGPLEISRGTTRISAGFEVDDMDLTALSQGDAILNGFSLQRLMQLGFMQDALVTVERLYFVDWAVDPSWNQVIMFYGLWRNGEIGSLRCTAHIKSVVEYLHRPWPHRRVSAGCPFVVFDADCTLDREAFKENAVCEAGTTAVKLYAPLTLLAAAGSYPLGYVKFTSGANSGLSMSIKSQGPGYVVLDAPMLVVPQIGDTFSAYQGCDLTVARCTALGNFANYGGQPNIPVP